MSASADGETEAMTDMLMSLTAQAQSERAGETGETFSKRKKEGKEERKKEGGGGGGAGMLVLFNSLPHCYWQQDLRRRFERCMVMNPRFRWNLPPPFHLHIHNLSSLFILLSSPLLSLCHRRAHTNPPSLSPKTRGIKELIEFIKKLVSCFNWILGLLLNFNTACGK